MIRPERCWSAISHRGRWKVVDSNRRTCFVATRFSPSTARLMTAKHFEELVERSHVGDEITIQVKRTGNGTVSAVPEPTMLDGKVEEFRFTLADQLEWVGPVGHPNPRSMHDVVDAIDRRVAPTTAPTEFESFVDRQLAANQLSKPIDDLEKLLIKTQQDDWGSNRLARSRTDSTTRGDCRNWKNCSPIPCRRSSPIHDRSSFKPRR
jgi:hypothetical protein